MKTLTMAVTENDNVAVTTLLQNGADADSRNNAGLTALILAAESNYRDIVANLLEKNAAVGLQNNATNIQMISYKRYLECTLVQ